MSIMGISTNKDINHVLGRKYNVEYLDGRGRCQTFNNTLINVDDTYFWFENEEDGLAMLRQDRVTFMYCTDRSKNSGNTGSSNIVYTITYGGETENELCSMINEALNINCGAVQIYVPKNKKELFEYYIVKGQVTLRKNVEVIQYRGCSVVFDN